MNNKINQIREILNEIENDESTNKIYANIINFDALEMPFIVSSIVDYLMPDLSPVEGVIYWYLFRNSILLNGKQHIRVGQSSLANIAASHHKEKDALSVKSVRRALKSLEEKSIIKIDGDTNHSGTLYKINIPDEIQSCNERKASLLAQPDVKVDEKKEVDYYNIQENRLKIFERDMYCCHYCKKQLTRFSASLDHIQPVSRGGNNSYDNLITACLHCNSRRGNRPVMEIIAK